jgi:hypothetical protein
MCAAENGSKMKVFLYRGQMEMEGCRLKPDFCVLNKTGIES